MAKPLEISRTESNYFFRNHHDRTLDFPEGLDKVCIEWAEKCIGGKLDPLTRRDSRKYEYRVRACRTDSHAILMDTGKFVTALQASKIVERFIGQQKEMDAALGR